MGSRAPARDRDDRDGRGAAGEAGLGYLWGGRSGVEAWVSRVDLRDPSTTDAVVTPAVALVPHLANVLGWSTWRRFGSGLRAGPPNRLWVVGLTIYYQSRWRSARQGRTMGRAGGRWSGGVRGTYRWPNQMPRHHQPMLFCRLSLGP